MQIIQYADDIVLSVAGENIPELITAMNKQLQSFGMWFEKYDLELAVNKYKAILFQSFNKIKKGGRYTMLPIITTKSLKYLGVILSETKMLE